MVATQGWHIEKLNFKLCKIDPSKEVFLILLHGLDEINQLFSIKTVRFALAQTNMKYANMISQKGFINDLSHMSFSPTYGVVNNGGIGLASGFSRHFLPKIVTMC